MSSIMTHEQKLAEFLLNMPMCIFCSNFHKSENCNKVISTVNRIEILLKRNLCLVCLSHHMSLVCPRTTAVCTMCKHMNHHIAICYRQDTKRDNMIDIPEDERAEEEK
uniref:Uncharacterized protein n=1 Tax=Caenorhabditis japonica TaxID=281687 RepID=A0A8R1I7N4_CAEJA